MDTTVILALPTAGALAPMGNARGAAATTAEPSTDGPSFARELQRRRGANGEADGDEGDATRGAPRASRATEPTRRQAKGPAAADHGPQPQPRSGPAADGSTGGDTAGAEAELALSEGVPEPADLIAAIWGEVALPQPPVADPRLPESLQMPGAAIDPGDRLAQARASGLQSPDPGMAAAAEGTTGVAAIAGAVLPRPPAGPPATSAPGLPTGDRATVAASPSDKATPFGGMTGVADASVAQQRVEPTPGGRDPALAAASDRDAGLRGMARPMPQQVDPSGSGEPTRSGVEQGSATDRSANRPTLADGSPGRFDAPGSMPAAASFASEMVRQLQPGAATPDPSTPALLSQSSPVTSPEFVQRFSADIAILARDGVQEARVQVHPVELGPITVQITLDGQTAQVHLAVDNAQTRQILESAMPTLAGALRESGLTLTGGGVFEQSRQGTGPDDGRAAAATAGGIAGDRVDDTTVVTSSALRLSSLRGALDLYA